MVDSFEHIMDVVVHYTYSITAFFYSGGGEFVIVFEVHGAWIRGMETSVW